jgi:hydrogenase expression/formation protein HypD
MTVRHAEDFRDPILAKRIIDKIAQVAEGIDGDVKLMEVCGTHTVAIAKHGLRDVMPDNVVLISGPGCPVCVTANRDIDLSIEMARQDDVILATFGDMMKVPGSFSSLSNEKAQGHDIHVVYSPLDALTTAEEHPDKHVVLLGVGFETTAPTVASAIVTARDRGLENFSVLSLHKTVPYALRALVDDPEVQVAGFILPGHVSTIIGLNPYEFLVDEYGVPSVIAGFEPIDVLQAIWMLVQQIADGKAEAEIAYKRGVMPTGNQTALRKIDEVFYPVDSEWRGIGVIPGTGMAIREEFAQFDAVERVPVSPPEPKDIPGCQCGDVLRGVVLPFECRLFAKACTPENPVGPCMVSNEGSCAAYYRYTDYGKEQ